VIISPVITEKATAASEQNKVVFRVRRDATKPQIKAAVEKLFDVKVEAVNTLLRKGKNKIFRGNRGVRSDVKQAVVTLVEGHKIDVTTGL
jgi:large subunit ribosomal protein L23